MNKSIVIIGGGAAGIFAAIHSKKKHPNSLVTVLEKTQKLLSKVKISGGGRCNVTHHCFDPHELAKNYPRGRQELIGPFHRFQPKDTIKWFASHGVQLKNEPDGRIFPVSDNSQTIIDCLLQECHKLGIQIKTGQKISSITQKNGLFEIEANEKILASSLIIATGSSPAGYEWAKSLGHSIIPTLPSLFTFNIPSFPLKDLSGISFSNVMVKIKGSKQERQGPILITHFGLSGPAVLKLSAFGAKELFEKNYQFDVTINWLLHHSPEKELKNLKDCSPQKLLKNENIFHLPKNFWHKQLELLGLYEKRLSTISIKEMQHLSQKLQNDTYTVSGKTIHKEEFVTCGGVSLKEINFKTMESKITPSLFFVGEILNIDGITGGFNFQNAWTTGYIAGMSS